MKMLLEANMRKQKTAEEAVRAVLQADEVVDGLGLQRAGGRAAIVHGRDGPDGWLARSKRKQVIATVKVMCVPRRLRKLSQPWRKLCQNAGICTRCRIGFHAREACPHANEIDRLMADIKGKAPNSKALGKG